MNTSRRWGRSRKMPKESRTIPMKGYGDDEGKYYRCWNCNHPCDVDRDALGGGEGVAHEDYTENATGANNGDPLTSIAILGAESVNHYVALELGSDGNPKEIRHDFQTVINSGCPHCGTRNWRGDV